MKLELDGIAASIAVIAWCAFWLVLAFAAFVFWLLGALWLVEHL